MRGFFGKDGQHGQAILIMAFGMVVLIGIAGLAVDGSNLYLVRRKAQNATDFAALAAGKQLAAATALLTAPPASGDTSNRVAHDFVDLNGFPTVYSTSCDTATSTSYSAVWFDAAGSACSATSGFKTKVQVVVPAQDINGAGVPDACTSQYQFSCYQVILTQRVDNYFGRTLGVPSFYFTVTSIVRTTPAIQGYSLPPPVAVYLYQPQSGCNPAAQQCFNEALPASRTTLSCVGANCPTLWVRDEASAQFYGTDGAKTIPVSPDQPALQSKGDIVLQEKAIFCDPYNGAVCKNNQAVGVKGFSLAAGSKLYCSAFAGGGSPGSGVPCTTTGQSGLNQVLGNETSFAAATWTPTVDTSGLPDCGGLVLNGGTVQSSFIVGGSASCYSTTEPYTIHPGRYQFIVINHGTYEFETGLFQLTGVAPVNTNSTGSYTANGIDHKNEKASDDWDLCNASTPAGCPTLTASVWIGHGGGAFGAFSSGSTGACVAGGSGGTTGGGGDETIISGSGVTFRFESTALGFVSTHQVKGIALSGPGVGAAPRVGGAPLLFDLENNSFIHLDGKSSGKTVSQFSGLIYQTQSATGGGVELNPGLGGGKKTAAVAGQIWAYSLTTFGSDGLGVDFTADYGGISQPGVSTSGKAEPSLVSSTSLTQAVDASGANINGWQTLTINYTDEWALDAYDLYLKVNNAQPVFFSKGIWNPVPPSGAAVPPQTNNPGDGYPAYPAAFPPAPYTAQLDPITGLNTFWSYPLADGTKFELWGNWTWGHEQDIPGTQSGNNRAVVRYTFPISSGGTVNITIFLTDGDHCGDYYLLNATFNNVGQPAGGSQSVGTVVLVR